MHDTVQVSGMTRRERLKREREERILDSAASVFAQKGFHQATIREIAEAADVADGTIYNYFDNKYDLLVAIMGRIAELEQLPGELAQALQGDVRDFFVEAFRDRLERIVQGEEMLKAVLPEVFVNQELRDSFYGQYVRRISSLLEAYVQAQVELGRIRQVETALAVRLVQGMFIGILFLRILGDAPLREAWEDVPEAFAALVYDGLSPQKGE
jgi:TetR/AcrR family fatty acid metabolism transcriptional regulator